MSLVRVITGGSAEQTYITCIKQPQVSLVSCVLFICPEFIKYSYMSNEHPVRGCTSCLQLLSLVSMNLPYFFYYQLAPLAELHIQPPSTIHVNIPAITFMGTQSKINKQHKVPINTTKTAPSGQRHVIVAELESFKDVRAGRVKIDYFVDEENTFIHPGYIVRVLYSTEWSASNILLVSGPDGFVDYWTGSKQ